MAKFEITFDLDELKREIGEITEDIHKGVEEGLKVCANEIKEKEQRYIEQRTGQGEYIPTGNLKHSVTIMPLNWSPGLASISVTNVANYADFTESGTGIYADNGNGRQNGWVYSPDGGNTFFFTEGMRPKHFARDTFEEYKDKAPAIIKEQIYYHIK